VKRDRTERSKSGKSDRKNRKPAPAQPVAPTRPQPLQPQNSTTPTTGLKSQQPDPKPSRPRQSRRRSRDLSPSGANASALVLRSKPRRAPAPPKGPLLWVTIAIRTLIFGVGIAALAGTTLSIVVPATQSLGGKPSSSIAMGLLGKSASDLQLTEELIPLKNQILGLASQNQGLTLGCFLLDLDTGGYVDINGTQVFSTASMIKFPLLVAFFQDVDDGRIKLTEKLTMRKDLVTAEAGDMQAQKPDTQFSALYTATEMIRISDNTATNMILDRLGGPAPINRRLQSLGLIDTSIKNPLPDLEGTNQTTPKDLANLMNRVGNGDLLSLKSRDRLLAIMETTVTDTLLPKGLGEGAKIAHKTGDIGSLVGDVGLIDMPTGKRYIAVVMVKRPYNDTRAQELIRQVSKTSYEFFQKQPQPAESKEPL
jgi:beta-lactamase class A